MHTKPSCVLAVYLIILSEGVSDIMGTGSVHFRKKRALIPEYPDCKDRSGIRPPQHNWVAARRNDNLQEAKAVVAGVFLDGLPTYVARLYHEGSILPGIARPNAGAWATHENIEIHSDVYEVLVSNNVTWVPATGGRVPHEAKHTGILPNGTYLYSCRAMDKGAFILESGKLMRGNPCSIPWIGKPAVYDTYEVLVFA